MEGQQTITNKKATSSLVLGIIGMIVWIIPLIGFPITIIALIFGIKGLKTTKRSRAIAGVVLAIIGLVLTIINSAIGAYMGATGQHPLLKKYEQNPLLNQNPLTESFKNCSDGYQLYALYYNPDEDGIMTNLKLEVSKGDTKNIYEMTTATSAASGSKFEDKKTGMAFWEHQGSAILISEKDNKTLSTCGI